MLFRQGDIYIESVRCLPEGAIKQFSTVLADGELTGHRHRILDFRTASVFDARGEMFIDVVADRAEVVHEEHATIELNCGVYRVWRQREYDPRATFRQRVVAD
jgi:hypothetical protein